MLLNNWHGYYGARDDVRVEQREGGLLVSVDLTDPTEPVATGSVFIEGYIRTSRLVSNDVSASLYVSSILTSLTARFSALPPSAAWR